MKSFLVIGVGTLGGHICNELLNEGCEVMIADINPDMLEPFMSRVDSARVCDCTKREVLNSFGVDEFDACFVCTGNNFQNCLEITDILKELGAKKIFSEAGRDIEEKFLLKNGADFVIYPERDTARRIAASESNKNVFDYFSISEDYAIFEIKAPEKWFGKTIVDIGVRQNYNINIVSIKKGKNIIPVITPDYCFNADEHLLVLAHPEDLKKILK